MSRSGLPHFRHPHRGLGFRRFALLCALLAADVVFAAPAAAQRPKPEEYQVKAVYLFNFGKFIEWPAAPARDESFTICVIGLDPFGTILDATIAGETIDNRKLVARRIAGSQDTADCRILYIASSEAARVKEIVAIAQKSAVLTVSDLPGFTGNGGMIQFVLRENKVRFEVNLSAAEKAGLTLSSQLLKVATDVRKEASGGSGSR